MNAMKSFVLWIFEELPDFLMSEPICYIVALFFLGLCIYEIKRICN